MLRLVSPLLQVKVFDLHGKNYGFTLSPTYQPIAEDNCVAVASKTRKNILITMQVCTVSVRCCPGLLALPGRRKSSNAAP